MPEVIFAGPEGRLEGRYQKGRDENPPVALILHPHPMFGGTMNNRACYELYNLFARKGFSVLRFNFRGVGRSQGEYDQGQGRTGGRRDRARLSPIHEPQRALRLGRRLFFRFVDFNAAFDAPAGNCRLHFGIGGGQSLRLFISSLPARHQASSSTVNTTRFVRRKKLAPWLNAHARNAGEKLNLKSCRAPITSLKSIWTNFSPCQKPISTAASPITSRKAPISKNKKIRTPLALTFTRVPWHTPCTTRGVGAFRC